MKKKTYYQLALFFILFNYFIVIYAVAVEEYKLEFNENTKIIWRVEEYDKISTRIFS